MVDDDFTGKFESYQDGIIAFYDLHFNYFDGYLRFEYIFAGMVVYILITRFFCMVFCKKLLTYCRREKAQKLQSGKIPNWYSLTYAGEPAYLDSSTPELRLILPEEVFTTPHGEKFHLKGCKHVRGNVKKFTACKDCHCKLQKSMKCSCKGGVTRISLLCSICSYHAGNTFPSFVTCGQFRPPNTFLSNQLHL